MKIATIVGARPQFIKAAPLSRILRQQHDEYLIHTGQHYDDEMSLVFFDELSIPRPDVNLNVGSMSHGRQTAEMLQGIETVLMEVKPDMLIVYGDTNSTLAGALAAVKLRIPLVHVEAGLRSFNRDMPEEINRVLTDRVSDVLCCPTHTAVQHLHNEGIRDGVHFTGDVMYDAVLHFSALAEQKASILDRLNLDGQFHLLTVHRASNTDSQQRLIAIVDALLETDVPIVFPVHPRTRSYLQRYDLWQRLQAAPHIRLSDPVGYLEMIVLEKHARKIITDSGGIQKEAYFFKVPCITLREETEWVETVDDGWNVLVGADPAKITGAIHHFTPPTDQHDHYGNGTACEAIVRVLEKFNR